MNFLNSNPYINVFERFNVIHIGILILTFFICFAVFFFRNRIRYSGKGKWLALFFTFFALAFQIIYLIWSYANRTSWAMKLMPLDFTWLCMILAMAVYVRKSKTLFGIFYFLSFYSVVNLISADFGGYGTDHFRFYHFFITNMYVLWSCIYFIFIENMELNLKSLITYNIFMIFFFIIIFVMRYAYGMDTIINIMNFVPELLVNEFGEIVAIGMLGVINSVLSLIFYLPWMIRKIKKDREVEIYQ